MKDQKWLEFRKTFPLFLILLLQFSFSTKVVKAQNHQEKPSQIFLSFQYKGIVNNVLVVYYTTKSVYLPIGQVFDLLKINNTIDKQKNIISGFYLKEKNKYQINFSSLQAFVGDQKFKISKSDFIATQLDYYVKISLLKKIFGLNFTPDMRNLSVTMTTSHIMPVEASLQRQRKEQSIGNSSEGRTYYPLLFKRKRYLFKTGMLDYDVNLRYNNVAFGNSVGLTGGLKFLGGNLIGSVGENSFGNSVTANFSNIEWQYVTHDGDPVTEVNVGDLFSNGLNSQNFEGIQITNQPIHERIHFEKYVIDGQTKPNYDVELFLNGRLIAHTKTGNDGHYHLIIPLDYGTSYVVMKFYGPEGQFHEERRRIQIPYTFLPKGDVSYSLNLGGFTKTRNSFYQKPDSRLFAPNLAWGLTNWFTDKIGVDYSKKPVFYNTASFRLSTPYLAALTLSPSNIYQFSLNALYPSQTSFNIQASHFGKNYYYNSYGTSYDEGLGSLYIPFHIFNHPFNLRLQGNVQSVASNTIYGYSIGANANWGRLTLTSGYTTSSNGVSSINNNMYLSLVNARKLPFFLNGSLIDGTFTYNGGLHKITNVGLGYSRTVLKYARLQLSWQRSFLQNQSTFQFRLIFNLPSLIATSSYNRTGSQYAVSQDFRGGIGYDSHNDEAMFNNRRLTGSADAVVKMFVDYNGNGIQDKGEPTIKTGSVTFDQAVSQRTQRNGLIYVLNLQPYYRYNMKINVSGIRNPLWIPSVKEFSFIANPNIVTPIDIPFYVSGVVNGAIRKKGKGIPGMNIHFVQLNGKFKKTITTFSDGSFYYIGLPPGQYKAYPDKKQMSILKSVSVPAYRTFTIKYSKNGVTINDLNFKLVKKGSLKKKSEKSISISSSFKDTTSYAIQIGAFHNIDRAIHRLSNANDREQPYFYLRFVPADSLFKVTTDCIVGRKVADSTLKVVKKNYPDAIERLCQTLSNKLKYEVQIGAFRSGKRAGIFEKNAQPKIAQHLHIKNDTTVKWYKIRFPSVGTWSKVANERNHVRKSGFKDAFVSFKPELLWLNDNFFYKVQLGAYDRKATAEYHQRILKSIVHYRTDIYYDPKTKNYRLFLRNMYYWQQAIIIWSRLEKIEGLHGVTVVMFKYHHK